MAFWKIPPRIKVFEALGTLGDKRIELGIGKSAKVFSSARNKFYSVTYDQETNAIMANDNGSYWQDYLGYPAIAVLMLAGMITYNSEIAQSLAGIEWKKVNTQFKNNYSKSEEYALSHAESRGVSREKVLAEVEQIFKKLSSEKWKLLGEKVEPPGEE